MSDSFAIYRLPYADECTMIRQTSAEPLRFDSCTELTGVEGFVFAPFDISADNPVVVLKPDIIETLQVAPVEDITDISLTSIDSVGERQSYSRDFGIFHHYLTNGDFSKIILSRRHRMRYNIRIKPETLFMRACRMYPRMFVALVSTPSTGTWLMATPEVLLEGEGKRWHTMALAGTMKLDERQRRFDIPIGSGINDSGIVWSKKNICEQRIVAQYISERLTRYSDDVEENGPYTVRAGNVVHLRSDFNFVLSDETHIGNIINDLHPTPAVCGMPKAETFDFIVKNEHGSRDFYSGFAGPLFSGTTSRLFVSLRCMRMEGQECCLYAGGGLLADSREQQEWDETEAKLETMKDVFNPGI